MANATALNTVAYYSGLLIKQYAGKPRAKATIEAQVAPVIMPQTSVQTVAFSDAPSSGAFVVSFEGISAPSINWNDSAGTIQTKLRTISKLAQVTVSGSLAESVVITFNGVYAPAKLLQVVSSTVDTGTPSITETDELLTFAVQNAFNLNEPVAVGAQLDIIGKYVGVSRTGQGLSSPINLNDDEYLTLIRMAVLTNSATSDLATIQDLIYTFFPGEMKVFDYQNMRMSYLISSSLGSIELIEMFLVQNLLPRPMGVQVAAIIYVDSLENLFGMRTYLVNTEGNSPLNSYSDYKMNRPWLSYADAISL